MKLDKIRFARLISYITYHCGSIADNVIEDIDDMIDVQLPEVQPQKASCADVDQLLMLMAEGTRKIEAIKAYRTLTGAALKESKDAVEKYWNSKGHYLPPET
jgi:ribosomal protein L7/L12